MKDKSKRLIKEISTTGFAAAILTLISVLTGVDWVLFLLLTPFNDLGNKIGSWIDLLFQSRGGGWLDGMSAGLEGNFFLAWIEIWIVLFVFVRLIRMQISRREKKDAEEFGDRGRQFWP
jgi:hypothetical protein